MTRLSRSVSLLSSASSVSSSVSAISSASSLKHLPQPTTASTNHRPCDAAPILRSLPTTSPCSPPLLDSLLSRRPPRLQPPSRCCAPYSRRWASSSAGAGAARPKTAIFFPGQGVQKVGMLTPWLEAFPITVRDMLQEIDHYMGYKLSAVIQDGPSRALTATANAQPAIVATSLLILRVLEREFGFRVADEMDVTLGHSLGEFAALVAGGYLQLEDGLFLLRRRAAAMARATEQARTQYGGEYGMVAVVTEPAYLVPLVDTIYRVLGFGDGEAGATGAAGAAGTGRRATATVDDHTARQYLRWRQQRLLYEDQIDLHAHWDEDGDGMKLVHPELRVRKQQQQQQPEASSTSSSSLEVPLPSTLVNPSELVVIANINSKNQIVLSGSIERIRTLLDAVRHFLGHDPRAVRLNSDSPFHSPIMRPAAAEMGRLLAGPSRVRGCEAEDIVAFPGRLPCISNLTARPFASRAELKELLARQCEDTVYWWDSIRYLDKQEHVRRWVGIGPGKVGRNLVGKEVGMRGKDLVKGGGVWAITDPSEIEEVLRGLEETASFIDEEE